jgi:cytochrome c oxidase cbb3-type subunit III
MQNLRSTIVKGSKTAFFLLLLLLSAFTVHAQQSAGPKESVWSNPLALSMIAIIFVLLLVIALLANVLLGTANWFLNKEKSNSGTTLKTIVTILFLSPFFSQAQTTAVTETPAIIGGLSSVTFFLLIAVITTELLVILVMAWFVKRFLSKEKEVVALQSVVKEKQVDTKALWDKLNKFRPVEQEAAIDLGHNYDGIRELDNKLPPWWLYGFYVTILFGVIYLWRYHVAETAPLSKGEYEIAMKKADEQKAAYLSKSANNIDENTVKLLTDPAALTAGKNIFIQTCAACHTKEGAGGVGPNLTDDYWLHGGSVKDIFKTIKYGWPEKGMKSWKDDYSPVQIAQLTSFVKSLHGTNPPNAKEKQGDLYKEESTVPVKDSSATNVKDTVAVKN